MMAFKQHDRRDVLFLTTFHKNIMLSSGKMYYKTGNPILKPEAIVDYNKHMGSVDKTDMLLSSLSCLRKSKKWYKKLGMHIMDLILLNSHASFKFLTGRKSYPLADFQFALIEQLILKHRGTITLERSITGHNDSLIRLIGRHFPSPVPPTEKLAKPFRRCHV